MGLFEIVIILWAVWAGLLFGGWVFGKPNEDHTRRMPRWTRLASSVVLVVLAIFWATYALPASATPFAILIAIGMALGCLGDFFMAQIFPVKQYVLGGMASFGLGHVGYIAAAIAAGWLANVAWGNYVWVWGVWWVIALGLWYGLVFRGSQKTTLHYAALPYALLLSSTAAAATMIALGFSTQLLMEKTALQMTIMAVGAVLFLLSDLILATRLFNHAHWRGIDDVVWLTYGPGQMLIVSAGIVPLFFN